MSAEAAKTEAGKPIELEEPTAADIGARHPAGPAGRLLFATALAWSLFQLWYASPLPFIFGVGVLDDTEARSIHLAFAMFLASPPIPLSGTAPATTSR